MLTAPHEVRVAAWLVHCQRQQSAQTPPGSAVGRWMSTRVLNGPHDVRMGRAGPRNPTRRLEGQGWSAAGEVVPGSMTIGWAMIQRLSTV
jgi:hypothetical protein